MVDIDKLREWMAAGNYQESTIRLTCRQVRQVEKRFDEGETNPPPKITHVSLRRYALFTTEIKRKIRFDAWLAEQGIVPAARTPSPKPRRRKLPAESLSKDDYRTILVHTAASDDPEAVVIHVLASTGLRIGDVLNIPTTTLLDAIERLKGGSGGVLPIMRKGGTWIDVPIAGAEKTWARLAAALEESGADNVADYVTFGEDASPIAGDLAYARVDRYFKNLGRELKLTGRIHLHRLRRTVAVFALIATNQDLIGVKQVLGHATIQTTEKYVDEINVERAAEIQKMLQR